MKSQNTTRFKIINRKKIFLCDYKGKCKNLAYKEVYPNLLNEKNKNKGWSYLCKKHFKQEQSRFKNQLPYAPLD